jgi:hypothetical protein
VGVLVLDEPAGVGSLGVDRVGGDQEPRGVS